MSDGTVGRGVVGALATIGLFAAILSMCGGCSTIKENIDLGDGKVAGIVPVSAVAAGANVAQPGLGKAINAGEAVLSSMRNKDAGPFGGLAFTTEYTVMLKEPASEGQTVITHEQIGTVTRRRIPVMPSPITDEISFDDVATNSGKSGWAAILDSLGAIQSNINAGTGTTSEAIDILTP